MEKIEYRFVDSYNNTYRPLIRVVVVRNHRISGIPFLFTYIDNVPPYDATFYYETQDVIEGTELVIDKMTIHYSDGTEADLRAQVEKVIVPELDEMRYLEDHVEIRKPCLRAKWTVRDCITQRGGFNLMMSGKLRKGDRVLEPFNVFLNCKVFSETNSSTRWYWWLASQA